MAEPAAVVTPAPEPAVAPAPATTPPAKPDWLADEAAVAAQLDKIVERRVPGLIKSALKENGVTDDEEIKAIVDSYRANKGTASKETAAQLEALAAENAALKAAQLKVTLDAAVAKVAGTLEVAPERVLALAKLAGDGIAKAVDKDGKIDEAAIKKALEDSLKDVPEFKKATNNKQGFTPVGADSSAASSQGGQASTPTPTKRWNRLK
jgi:hypothetical protein